MKKENGITLVSLVIYIMVMILVLGVMSVIMKDFHDNTETLQGNVEEVLELSKFNNYFLKEVKTKDNKVEDFVNNKYILFTSGNSFSLYNNSIYYNNIKVCDKVKKMEIIFLEDRNVIDITLTFNSFTKNMRYKIENIY